MIQITQKKLKEIIKYNEVICTIKDFDNSTKRMFIITIDCIDYKLTIPINKSWNGIDLYIGMIFAIQFKEIDNEDKYDLLYFLNHLEYLENIVGEKIYTNKIEKVYRYEEIVDENEKKFSVVKITNEYITLKNDEISYKIKIPQNETWHYHNIKKDDECVIKLGEIKDKEILILVRLLKNGIVQELIEKEEKLPITLYKDIKIVKDKVYIMEIIEDYKTVMIVNINGVEYCINKSKNKNWKNVKIEKNMKCYIKKTEKENNGKYYITLLFLEKI